MSFFKKKKKLSTVSTGVLPGAAFAALPEVPAPTTPPAKILQCAMSTGVLRSSLLGKTIYNTDGGMDGDPLSDPESSLYDYKMMDEAGYSSVEFGAAQRRPRISYSDREKEPSPAMARREHAIDDMQEGGDMYHILEPSENQRVTDIYATPNKPGRRKQQSGSHQSFTDDGQSLQQTGQRVRDAMRAVHDMPSDSDEVNETLISADVHRSSRNELIPGDKESSIKETSVKHVEEKTPRTPSKKEKQEVSQKAEPRHIVQEEVIQATHRSGSNTARSIKSLPRSGSATACSTDDVQRSLEGENSLLRSKTEQLESEVHSLQQVTAALDRGDQETAANLLLRKQLTELKEENDTLKSAVHRLSVELSSYQAKYRPLSEGQVGDILGLPSKGPIPSWLINIRYLAPLFLAYDDRIQEKDNILRKYQDEMERLRIDAEDIITENQELHTKLESAMTKGPVDINEWEQLKENAKLVLEENQNLLEQIDVKDQKSHDLHQAHVREVSKLTKELVQLKSEKSDTEMEIQDIRKKYKDIKHKYDEIMLDHNDKTAAESYLNTISELKKNIQDLQASHKEETENLRIKIQVSQGERKKQTSQMIDLTAENKRLQAEMKSMHKAVKKAQSKMMYLQHAIEQSESKEYSVQEYLATVIKMAEKTAMERDTYAKVAKEQEFETKKAVNKMVQGNVTKGKVEEKLKLYRMKAAAKINTIAARLKDQDNSFNSQKKEYEREINHLRMLLKEKELLNEKINMDKRDTEEELEVIWQAAVTENDKMKEVLKHSLKKLRQHENLSDLMDKEESRESQLVYISSDGDE